MSRTSISDSVRLFGIRHHGPGSARSLVAALNEWQPQAVLVECPSGSESLIPFLLDPAVETPVAMLEYALDTPRLASYYPLAEFSPELQAFRWAAAHEVPVTFMDLPSATMLALRVVGRPKSDAMEQIATAAGFDDGEDWWEHLVEHRSDASELFAGIDALMCALREAAAQDHAAQDAATQEGTEDEAEAEPEQPEDDDRRKVTDAEFNELREAFMRRTIRAALAKGHERIAVVCGAWHVPSLKELQTAKPDDALLKGLPKLKVGSTIVPWTYERLTFASGYGAGARSPAFYDLLWKSEQQDISANWLLSVARLMREEDLDASPASVIEAVRLADALASLRGRPKPGLRELRDAANSVLIRDAVVWNLIGKRLIVGERMGNVPDFVPMIPLQANLSALQKRLRMKVSDGEQKLELDLRNATDLERSQLLHRLALLKVDWGIPEQAKGKRGTFHEHWLLGWTPELTIALIEASLYGNTVESAATSCAIANASEAESLAEIARRVERVLEADLSGAIEPTVTQLQAISAVTADVADLASALPPLAAVVRYGSVRGTRSDLVVPVLDAIFTRLCLGLPPACHSLDEAAARVMAERISAVSGVVALFGDPAKTDLWLESLRQIAELNGIHRLVQGKAERVRFDLGAIEGESLAIRLGQEASSGATALETAMFVEGLLDGPGTILLHQIPLLEAVDAWVTNLDTETVDEILPLIRRTFSLFTKPERRQIGERLTGGATVQVQESDIDEARANRVLPVIRQILGLTNV